MKDFMKPIANELLQQHLEESSDPDPREITEPSIYSNCRRMYSRLKTDGNDGEEFLSEEIHKTGERNELLFQKGVVHPQKMVEWEHRTYRNDPTIDVLTGIIVDPVVMDDNEYDEWDDEDEDDEE
jgi:hypothetical protein